MRHLIRIARFFLHDPRLLLRYIGAGAVAASVEFLLFTTFYDLAQWPLLVANSAALGIAVILCFVLQKHWTFRSQGYANQQIWLYLFMQSISAVINNLLMLGFVAGLGFNAQLAKILQIGIVVFWNYSFCRLVVFAPHSTGADRVIESFRRLITPVGLLASMILAYVSVFGYLTWQHQSNFGTFGYDMGIYDQGIWLLSRFSTPFLTVRGLNYFGHHVNLITVLFVPFYWLGAGPKFLYITETIILAIGAIPLWLLARYRFNSSWAALVPAAAYLLYPSLEWINWWHFHPDALIITPLLFAWWFAVRLNWKWYGISIVITLACKEDAALAAFMMGFLIAWQHWRKRQLSNDPDDALSHKGLQAGLITILMAAGWWLICTKLIIPLANNGAGPFYGNLFPGFGNSIPEVAATILQHPERLWNAASAHDCIIYYSKLLLPVAFLPLLSPATLIGLPQLLVNVISAHEYTHDIKYHYSSVLIAALFLGTVETVGRLAQRRNWVRMALLALLTTTAVGSNYALSPSPLGKEFRSGIWVFSPQPQHSAVTEALELVPPDAAVAATYYIVPHLTHRRLIYEFPNPFITENWGIDGENPGAPEKVEFLVLDTSSLKANESGAFYEKLTANDGTFKVIFSKGGIEVAKRRSQ